MTALLRNNTSKALGILIGFILVFLLVMASIKFGYTKITWKMIIAAYTNFDGSNEHIIIQQARMPRALIALVVGASLAISGTLIQGLTRNPLASPGILGINAGAGFMIVLAVSFFNISSLTYFTWLAFFGALLVSGIVFLIGSIGSNGLTPIKLTLAGASMAALLSSLTQGMLAINEKALDEVLFWLAGSVQGRKLEILFAVLPYISVGFILALLIASKMNVLTMGEDIAKGLGQRTILIKVTAIIVIVILSGGSVAIAGPIGFIGIVIPHVAKWLVGLDYRWIIPYSALLGSMLLLLADIGARYIIMPNEVPVGVMTALIGTPFFIYIARRRLGHE